MSTQFTNRQWRLPNNENKDKQSNYSMDFDGSSYVDAGNDSSLTPTNGISISLWVKTNDSGNYIGLIDKWSSSTGYMIHLGASGVNQGKPVFGIGASDISSSVAVNDGSWHHVAVTCDNTTGYIYVDGVQTGTGSLTMSGISNSDNLKIAGDNASTFYLDGQIDAVSIFDYALSSSQITTLYGSSSTGIGNPMTLNPVAYYPLGDQDAFNGANYLVPNSSLKDYVFDFENSSNQYISGTASLPNSDYTISAWINLETVTTEAIVSWGEDAVGERRALVVWNGGSGDYKLYSSTYGSNIAASTTLVTGQWYHVAVTVSSAGVAKIYLNGSQDGTGTNTLNAFTSTDFYIGRTPSGEYFDGRISNAQIFNTALPATGSNSVETLYNNGSPLTSMTGFTSLQGWWKLDASATYDSSTTTWTIPDNSTNSNDGTSSGMNQSALQQSDLSFKTSISPFSLSFDGTNDYIDIVNSSTAPTSLQSLGNSNSYSISSWINTTTTDTYSALWFAGKTILEMRNEGTTGIHVPFNLSVSSGKLFFGRSSNYTTSSENYSSTTSVNTGFWVHCITTVDNNTLKLYINGSLDSTHTFTSATGDCSVGSNTSNFFIGSRSTDGGGNDAYMDGKLSNISIWNTALTSAQVTEIYSEGIPQNLNNHSAVSSLISWWQLGSNSSFNTNWTVLDEKGSNNGTSANMGEDDIVDGVGSYANGLSSGMGGDEVIGDAPYSTANSLSVNMDVLDRVEDTPA